MKMIFNFSAFEKIKNYVTPLFVILIFGCGENGKGGLATEQAITPTTTTNIIESKVNFSGIDFNFTGENLLVSRDENGVSNLYQYSVDSASNKPLTRFESGIANGVSWFPSDDRLLFRYMKEISESQSLYVLDTEGKQHNLTPGQSVASKFLRWKSDKRSFFVLVSESNSTVFHLYEYQVSNYQRKLLFNNTQKWTIADVSPNGRWLALIKSVEHKAHLYLLDLISENSNPILISALTASNQVQRALFSPDSSKLIYSKPSVPMQFWSYQLNDRESNREHRSVDKVEGLYFSKNGDYRIVEYRIEEHLKLSIIEDRTGESITLPALPPGKLRDIRFSPNSLQMAFYIDSESTTDLYVYSIDKNTVIQLTSFSEPFR